MMELSSKQRAYLRSLASNLDPLFSIGKNGLTPEVTEAVSEAFANRELIKLNIQKNLVENEDKASLMAMADMLAERTKSTNVCLTGRKLVLYKPFSGEKEKRDDRIILPKK